jgi:hypothetical protein
MLQMSVKSFLCQSNYRNIYKNAPIQILRYLGEAYHKQLAAKEKLRPIIPLLYYHGSDKWKFRQFENMFDSYPEAIKKYLPLYTSEFVNLGEMGERELNKLRNSMLHATLEVQRYCKDPAILISKLSHIGENLNPYLNHGFAIKILLYLLQTTEVTKNDFKGYLPKPIIDTVMSTYDQIKAEGVSEGIKKVILNSYDNGIEIKTIQVITGESIQKSMRF